MVMKNKSLRPKPVGQPAEEQGAEHGAGQISAARDADFRIGKMQRRARFQGARDGSGQRHLEAVEDPGDAESGDDQNVKPAPRQPLEPRGYEGCEDARFAAGARPGGFRLPLPRCRSRSLNPRAAAKVPLGREAAQRRNFRRLEPLLASRHCRNIGIRFAERGKRLRRKRVRGEANGGQHENSDNGSRLRRRARPLACATPAAAQDAAHALPNYRPGDFVQGIGVVFAAPFQIVFTPTLEVLGGWPVGSCQRTKRGRDTNGAP